MLPTAPVAGAPELLGVKGRGLGGGDPGARPHEHKPFLSRRFFLSPSSLSPFYHFPARAFSL